VVALRRIGAAAAIALLVVACNVFRSTSACEADTDCERGTPCAAAGGYCRTGAPLAIGVLLPVTGNQSARTPLRLQGLRFGQWLVDREPQRILGRGLAFVVEDTLSSEEQTGPAAQRLVAKNVLAVIGPASSAEVLEAQKVTFPHRLLHVAPSAGASEVGDAQAGGLGDRFLFQLSSEISYAMNSVPLFLTTPTRPAAFDACYDGVALVVTDDTTGKSYEDAFRTILPRNCLALTTVVTVPREKKGEYAAEVQALSSASRAGTKTRCIFMSVRPDVGGEMLRELKAYEASRSIAPYTAFMASSLLHSQAFVDEAKSLVAGEPSHAEGFYGVDADGAPPRVEFRDLQALWQEYLATHPDEVDDPDFGERAYWAESMVLLALAIELAGTADDPAALRDALVQVAQPGRDDLAVGPRELAAAVTRIRTIRAGGGRASLDYRGGMANYTFDDRGFTSIPRAVWRVRNGVVEQFVGFDEERMIAAATSMPGPACAR
jgi:ABC-type branched-subunit amino acid transport system substrate-binding protein